MCSIIETITECSLNTDQEYKYVLLRDNHMSCIPIILAIDVIVFR
jgi:hypothetical protein